MIDPLDTVRQITSWIHMHARGIHGVLREAIVLVDHLCVDGEAVAAMVWELAAQGWVLPKAESARTCAEVADVR